ncbi:hypothetical protein, partial [Gemmatimonas sp.]|uniref:hypothetical protein n=1 Tax=Gemmatimonas sp. TaxID=1962908 RepID=UPI0035648BB6
MASLHPVSARMYHAMVCRAERGHAARVQQLLEHGDGGLHGTAQISKRRDARMTSSIVLAYLCSSAESAVSVFQPLPILQHTPMFGPADRESGQLRQRQR